MVSAHDLLVFAPVAALVAVSPGANNLLALQHGIQAGAREALIALGGRLAGFALMLALACVGLAAVLTRSQEAFTAIKWAGVAYLAYLGLRGLLGRGGLSVEGEEHGGRGARARREFVTVAANPKALLLFTAFLPQFVDRGAPVGPQLLVYGCAYIALEMAGAAVWAAAGHGMGASGLGARARRRLDRVFGGVFVAFAGVLALEERR